LKHTAEEHILR